MKKFPKNWKKGRRLTGLAYPHPPSLGKDVPIAPREILPQLNQDGDQDREKNWVEREWDWGIPDLSDRSQ